METKAAGSTLYFVINTHQADGTPITWAGSPAVAVTKDGGTTTETDGVSLSVDAGGVTGRHIVTIDTSQDATFFDTGHKFSVIVTAGTVDSVSTVGLIVAEFELGEVRANVATWNGGALPVPAEAGDEMDLVDAPNSTAVSAIQSGLATPGDIPDISDLALEATVAALNNLSAAEVEAAIEAYGAAKPEDLANLDAAISSRLAAEDYVVPPTVEEVRVEIDDNSSQFAAVLSAIGALHIDQGETANEYTVRDTDGVTPLPGVRVTVSTDAAGLNKIVTRWTDAFGKVIFMLDPGTYYLWRWRADKSFADPDPEVVG